MADKTAPPSPTGSSPGVLSDPKVEFAKKAVQAIKDTKSADGSAAGEKATDRIARAAGSLGEQAAKVAINEGLARAADVVAPGTGGVAVKAVLQSKPGKILVDKTSKVAGKVVEKSVRWWKWALLIPLGGILVPVVAFVFILMALANLMAGGSRDAEVLDARFFQQTRAVAPPLALGGSSFSGGGAAAPNVPSTAVVSGLPQSSSSGTLLGTVTRTAHAALVEHWIEVLIKGREGEDVVEVVVEITDFEIIWAEEGGIRLTATVTTVREDDEGNVTTEEEEEISEYWYYQAHLQNCHPAALAASVYAAGSVEVDAEECWKLHQIYPLPNGPTTKGWIASALGGAGESWDPPLYDYTQCVVVTGEREICADIFDNLVVGESPDGPTAAYMEALPTVNEVLDEAVASEESSQRFSLLAMSDQQTLGEQDSEDMEDALYILGAESALGDFGQVPITEDGLKYEYEVLTSEGAEQLTWDIFTAWLAWHARQVHVPHHWPPLGQSDLDCSGGAGGISPYGSDYNSEVSPIWEGYAAGAGVYPNMSPTPRGRMWVRHYQSMGSSLSAWAKGDVLGGCITRSMLALLGHIAARKPINVAPLRSGHAPNVAGGDRESLHHRGRGADIGAVDGKGIQYSNTEGYWLWRFLVVLKEQGHLTIEEIGSPWDLPDPINGDGIFVDDDHLDHIHVGVCGARYESISGGATSDSC